MCLRIMWGHSCQCPFIEVLMDVLELSRDPLIPDGCPRTVLGCPYIFQPAILEDPPWMPQDRPGMSLQLSTCQSRRSPLDVPGPSWDVLTIINLLFRRIPHGCPRMVLGCPYNYQPVIPEDPPWMSQDGPGMSLQLSTCYSGGSPMDVPGWSWDVLTIINL